MPDGQDIILTSHSPEWGTDQYFIELKQQIPINEVEVETLRLEISQVRIKLYFMGLIILSVVFISIATVIYYPVIKYKLDGSASEIGTIAVAILTISAGSLRLFYNNIIYYWDIVSLKAQQQLAIKLALRELEDAAATRELVARHG